jgi:hypothetical protein
LVTNDPAAGRRHTSGENKGFAPVAFVTGPAALEQMEV